MSRDGGAESATFDQIAQITTTRFTDGHDIERAGVVCLTRRRDARDVRRALLDLCSIRVCLIDLHVFVLS
jgi:hypothetical protein